MELPISVRIITNLLVFIARAGGPGELGTCLTIMREADPIAAAACENFVRQMRASGVDI